MNDLITTISKTDELLLYQKMHGAGFPDGLIDLIREYQADMAITNWDDFARRFLMGSGKAKSTYSTYLVSCRKFHEFTGGLHPVQAGTPEWIEQYYDSLDKLDLNTRVLRMRSLKFMYAKVEEKYSFCVNPFNEMSESLSKKLNRSKKDESERDSLTETEYKGLLKSLQIDKSVKGLQDYSFIRFGVTSGMRAQELVNLRWENIQKTETGYSATFIGKGNKVRTIQIETEAVQACRRAFRERFGRVPRPFDKVLNSRTTEGISKSGLHLRIKAVVEVAKDAEIIRRNLHVSTHVLRHTCATRLLDAGVDIYSVSRHLGHSNVSTTDRYLHTRQDLTAAFEKMAS